MKKYDPLRSLKISIISLGIFVLGGMFLLIPTIMYKYNSNKCLQNHYKISIEENINGVYVLDKDTILIRLDSKIVILDICKNKVQKEILLESKK